ncbi:MAG: APC family permease [Pirellulaceae bacterium]
MTDLDSSLASHSDTSLSYSEDQTLARTINRKTAMAIVIGIVIGSGIFYKHGAIASTGASFTMIISCWILAGVISLLGALCVCELALMMPTAGGYFHYVSAAFGRPFGFMAGWNSFVLVHTCGCAALSVACVSKLSEIFGKEPSEMTKAMMACVVLAVVVWINCRSVKASGGLQLVATVIKAGFLVLLALSPLLFFSAEATGFETANYASTLSNADADGGITKSTFSILAAVLVSVLWSYQGWSEIAPAAEEIKDPQKNITPSIVGGVVIITVIYVLVTIAFHGTLNMDELKNYGEAVPNTVAERSLSGFSEGVSSFGNTLVSVIIVLSTFSALNSVILTSPRVAFAMARDGLFFKSIGKIHPITKVPANAICLLGGLSVVFILLSTLKLSSSDGTETSVFNILTNFSVFSAAMFFVLSVSSVVMLRISQPDRERPYRVPYFKLIPPVFILFNIWFVVMVFIDDPINACVGIGLMILSFPVYAWLKSRNAQGTNLNESGAESPH